MTKIFVKILVNIIKCIWISNGNLFLIFVKESVFLMEYFQDMG